MKIVREHINEKFREDSDPIRDMGIGSRKLIKEWLEKYEKNVYEPTINDDFTINARGINFHAIPLPNGEFPEFIKFNEIHGTISMYESGLKNFKGFPKKVDFNLYIGKNQLTSLEGIPKEIGLSIMLFENKLLSLKNCPRIIKDNFNISHNKELTSLEYMPQEIWGDFICFDTGMSDKYIREYINDNKILIQGSKIIDNRSATLHKYI